MHNDPLTIILMTRGVHYIKLKANSNNEKVILFIQSFIACNLFSSIRWMQCTYLLYVSQSKLLRCHPENSFTVLLTLLHRSIFDNQCYIVLHVICTIVGFCTLHLQSANSASCTLHLLSTIGRNSPLQLAE